jgi:hypothetical protein
MKPIIAAGNINPGVFHPTKAPEKHRASKIPVLFTAPSSVILSLKGSVESFDSKFLVNAGLAVLPNILEAECLDINILLIK